MVGVAPLPCGGSAVLSRERNDGGLTDPNREMLTCSVGACVGVAGASLPSAGSAGGGSVNDGGQEIQSSQQPLQAPAQNLQHKQRQRQIQLQLQHLQVLQQLQQQQQQQQQQLQHQQLRLQQHQQQLQHQLEQQLQLQQEQTHNAPLQPAPPPLPQGTRGGQFAQAPLSAPPEQSGRALPTAAADPVPPKLWVGDPIINAKTLEHSASDGQLLGCAQPYERLTSSPLNNRLKRMHIGADSNFSPQAPRLSYDASWNPPPTIVSGKQVHESPTTVSQHLPMSLIAPFDAPLEAPKFVRRKTASGGYVQLGDPPFLGQASMSEGASPLQSPCKS